MVNNANPKEHITNADFSEKQTVEFRCPDGSANIYLLMAGLVVAANHGLNMPNALELASKTYVDVNIFHEEFKDKVKELKKLPLSCFQSGDMLLEQQNIYLKDDVFTQNLINGTIKKLKSYNDESLREKLIDNPVEVIKLVNKYFNCG